MRQPEERRGIPCFLDHFEEVVAAGLLALVSLISLVEVVSRYGFGRPLIWPEEIARMLFVWCVMIGAAAALRRNELITIDAVYRLLPSRGRVALDTLVFCLVLATLVLLLYHGVTFVAKHARDITPLLKLPKALFDAAAPAGAALMLVRLFQWYAGQLRAHRAAERG